MSLPRKIKNFDERITRYFKACSCDSCVHGCKHDPGWFTPEEAKKAIDAGFAKKLMLDWWEHYDGNIPVLSPASLGCGGTRAPSSPSLFSALFSGWSRGQCVFLNKKQRCDLHDSGFKPLECRIGCHAKDQGFRFDDIPTHEHMAALWNIPEAQKIVEEWRKITGCDLSVDTDYDDFWDDENYDY